MTQTAGKLLREAREARGLTLEEVERATHIRARHLAALEAEDFGALPSAAQARGFLSLYAQYLELDTAQILSRYDEVRAHRRAVWALPAAQRNTSQVGVSRARARPSGGTPASGPHPASRGLGRAPQVRFRRPRLLSPDLLVATLITLLLAMLLLWGGSQLAAGIEASATAPAGAQTTSTVLGAAGNEPASFVGEATATLELPTPLPSYTGVNLVVRAEQRAWVRVAVDGAEAFAGLMAPGDAREFVGQTVVEVVTGNGKGTRVIWNGRDQGVMGDLGEVVDRLWTLEGMVVPTNTPEP